MGCGSGSAGKDGRMRPPRRRPSSTDGTFRMSNTEGQCASTQSFSDGEQQQEGSNSNSNERLLGTAFVSFMCFALVQLLFAFVAGSEAMMGDSAAMIVDALTYLFNYIAERRKNRFDELYSVADDEAKILQLVGGDHVGSIDVEDRERTLRRIRERAKRKMVLQLEIIPPFISVTTLVVVIGFVLRKALRVLYLDMHRSPALQGNPNVNLMLAFSVFNLGLDGLNVFCFAKSKHLFGYSTTDRPHAHIGGKHAELQNDDADIDMEAERHLHNGNSYRPDNATPRAGGGSCPTADASNGFGDVTAGDFGEVSDDDDGKEGVVQESEPSNDGVNNDHDDDEEDDENKANLNMCSAYTHVFADTLQSV